MKQKPHLKTNLIKGFTLILALCYLIAPLKTPVFNALHQISHILQSIKLPKSHKTSFYVHHEHDAFGNHISSEKEQQRAHHKELNTKKTEVPHSHEYISLFSKVFNSSDEHEDPKESVLKLELDKHFISTFQYGNSIFLSDNTQNIWPDTLSWYSSFHSTLNPPPRVVS
ncbi:hypothetical protein [Formosa sp. S-31]|uniref:hypothetical protein n=1 Tax=Formosa sp. S-31 TaxID=2790949 RepID=UPI003EBB1D09